MSEELETRLAAVEGLAGRIAMARVKDGVATVMLDAMRACADRYGLVTDELLAGLVRHLADEEDLIIPLILDRGEDGLGMG